MPKRQVHNFVNKTLLGNNYSNVSKWIDYPIKFLPGPKHRYLFHDLLTASTIGALVSPKNRYGGVVAAVTHVVLDSLCTKSKDVKTILKFLEKSSRRKVRRRN